MHTGHLAGFSWAACAGQGGDVERFNHVVAALGFLVALGIVGYVVVFKEGDAATVALGALVGVVGAGVGWYFRGKVQTASMDASGPPVSLVPSVPTVPVSPRVPREPAP